MESDDLDSLIQRFVSTVASGPPTIFGTPREYFRKRWIEIKQIGPSFKTVRYPTGSAKHAAHERFQAAVETLKQQQSAFQEQVERRSAKVRDNLLWLADCCRPSKVGIVEALFAAAEDVTGTVLEAGITAFTLGLIKPDFSRAPNQWLKDLSENLQRVWSKFKERQHEMIRDDHQQVFEKLCNVREELDAAWAAYKEKNQTEFERRQKDWEEQRRLKAEKHEKWKRGQEEWRTKQKAFLDVLRTRLSNQESYLERKETQLSNLNDQKSSGGSAKYIERIEGWIDECEAKIAEVESDIAEIKRKIREVEDKLSEG